MKSSIWIALVLALGACGSKGTVADAGEAPRDTVDDRAALDDRAAADTAIDRGMEAGSDRGIDAAGDAGKDLPGAVDVATAIDTGVDVRIDAGADAGFDSRLDAGIDAGLDVGVGTGVDVGVDAGIDAGVDAGCDFECWKRGTFGPPSGWPRTIQRAATTRTSDFQCVVVSSACLAQNSPPCRNVAETRTTTLDLTIQADGSVTVEAPYQDMCTADYVGGVVDASRVPTGEAVPTSYAVPLASRLWYFIPRSIDYCRVDLNGVDTLVQHRAVTAIDQGQIVITQDCATTLLDTTNGPSLLHDTRHYETRVAF